MPNWCSNSITIEGPVDKIRAIWEQITFDPEDNEAGLLNALYPEPEDIGDEWYGWRVDNWGTKWEVSSEGLEFVDNEQGRAMITGWFDSAWAPPIGAYEQFLEQNPDCSLEASYFEPGMDFAGFWDNGSDEYCENLHDVWENDPDNELFRRLDEEYNLVEQFQEWDEEFSEEE
jgi:hypothetical protein